MRLTFGTGAQRRRNFLLRRWGSRGILAERKSTHAAEDDVTAIKEGNEQLFDEPCGRYLCVSSDMEISGHFRSSLSSTRSCFKTDLIFQIRSPLGKSRRSAPHRRTPKRLYVSHTGYVRPSVVPGEQTSHHSTILAGSHPSAPSLGRRSVAAVAAVVLVLSQSS